MLPAVGSPASGRYALRPPDCGRRLPFWRPYSFAERRSWLGSGWDEQVLL
jgi:hypothetical protein